MALAQQNFESAEQQRPRAEQNFDTAEQQRRLAQQNFETAQMQRRRAEQNFEIARSAVDEMLTSVGQQTLAYEPHMEKVAANCWAKPESSRNGFWSKRATTPTFAARPAALILASATSRKCSANTTRRSNLTGRPDVLIGVDRAISRQTRVQSGFGELPEQPGPTAQERRPYTEAEQSLRQAQDLRLKLANEHNERKTNASGERR